MAFTPNDDLNILQATDNSVIGAGRGDDTYILSPGTMSPGQRIIISDTQGVNTLQFLDGLEISSASVANNAVQLTLSNGAVVALLDAASFNFSVGGTVGSPATPQTYEAFAAETLGVSIPAAGEDPIRITLDGSNAPPATNDDTATVVAGEAVTVDVLANDSDPEDNALTITAVTQGQHGSVEIINNGLALRYIANADYSGSDQFENTADDGQGNTATSSVRVDVDQNNQTNTPFANAPNNITNVTMCPHT